MKKSFGVLLGWLSLLLAPGLRALPPHPSLFMGPRGVSGFTTWMAPEDARKKTWQLGLLEYELRNKDPERRHKALAQLGFEPDRIGKETPQDNQSLNTQYYAGMTQWPEWRGDIDVAYANLSFNYRRMLVMSAPYFDRSRWAVIVFVQQPDETVHAGDDSAYWQPWQLFVFDTDPVPGLKIRFPDILSDSIPQMAVRHIVKDDHFGNREVVSIFKFDDRGEQARLQLTWQETDQYFRSGKFQGDPSLISQKLVLGDQRIDRRVEVKKFYYTVQGEQEKYHGIKPRKVEHYRERFSWNPIQFSFYDAETELNKLARSSANEMMRRDAARRLGLVLSESHPWLLKAALGDKSAYVRAQAALSLEDIGDVRVLPALKKALDNTEEDDTVIEALEHAIKGLEAKAARSGQAIEKTSDVEAAAQPASGQAASQPTALPSTAGTPVLGPGRNPIPTVGPRLDAGRR